MRSNFRPNIRLATNILLVIGTFAIVLNIKPIADVYQEKNLCIKYLINNFFLYIPLLLE